MLADSLQWGIAAGLGTLVGAVLIFIKRHWSPRGLAFFLGLAAGVMIAVVVFDMLPSALLFGQAGIALGGIALGYMFMVTFDHLLGSRRSGSHSLLGLGYLILLGIALHDLPEGMAIALGDVMKNRTGMVIALGIGIHNIPEGMAIAVPLVMAGMNKPFILVQVLLLSLITPIGTLLGIYLIFLLPALMPLLLGLASGIMAYLVAFQLWPQAKTHDLHSGRHGFWLGMIIILAATFV